MNGPQLGTKCIDLASESSQFSATCLELGPKRIAFARDGAHLPSGHGKSTVVADI
jgi:hypothetical protein